MAEIGKQTVIVEWQADLAELEAGMTTAEKKFNTSTKAINKDLDSVARESKKTGDAVKNNLEGASTAGSKFGKTLRTVGETAAGMFVALGAVEVTQRVVGFFVDATKAAANFEDGLAELSAITGATGKDLEFYSEQAREIGRTTTVSADQAVEAFKLIGSAKPELLENKEALAAITREAVTLAEASGLDLPTAASSLTDALNQFSLPADEASRVINVLAAGAQAGAAEIPQATDALLKFGVAASSAGISVEESVAAVQLLAEKGLQGSEAGNQLRNVLSRLSAVDALSPEALEQLEKFDVDLAVLRDSTVPVEDRLRELGKISGDATALVKVFGQENRIAGQIVLQNVDRFSELAEAVTGTQTAYDQARINTQDFNDQTKRLTNAITDFQLSVGSLILKALAPLVAGLTAVINGLSAIPQFVRENSVAFKGLAAGLALLNAQLIATKVGALAAAAAKKVLAVATTIYDKAVKLLNISFATSPIGAFLKVLGLLVTAFTLAYNKSETFRNAIAGLISVAKTFGTIIKETFGGFIEGFELLVSGNITAGLKKIGASLVNLNPIGLAAKEGKRLAESFNKGFEDARSEELAGRVASDAAQKLKALGNTWLDQGQNILFVTNATKGNTKATEENTGALGENGKASEDDDEKKKKKLTLLGKLQEQLSKYTEQLENLPAGSEAFENTAKKARDLQEQIKTTKQAIEDALKPPTQLELLNRKITETKEALERADQNSPEFTELALTLRGLQKEYDSLKEKFETPLNLTVSDKIENGTVARLKGQLEQIQDAINQAILSGNNSLTQRLDKQLVEVRTRLLAFQAQMGDEDALNEYLGLTRQANADRKAKIDAAVQASGKATTDAVARDKAEREKVAQEAAETEARLRDQLKESTTQALDSLNQIAGQQLEVYQEAVGRQTERIERFRELARTGSAEQLVIEEERLAKLTELQERAAARQRRIAEAQLLINQAVTVSESVKAIAKAFGDGGALGIITGLATSAALALTLASTASQVSGIFSNLPKFRTGSEFIEGAGTGTSDSILARVSRGERIVPARENMEIARLGGIPNKRLPEAVAMWQSAPAIVDAIWSGNAMLLDEMRQVKTELIMSRLEAQKTRVSILATRKGLAAMVSDFETTQKMNRR